MKCVHCGNDIQKKDKDHLFPKSWYPDTTSEKVQRWTIPSCVTCNREYGKIEEEMLITIGMSTEPHYASTGISQKAFSALDQSRAKNEKDRLARAAALKKIQGRLIHGVSTISEGVIPNLARRKNQNIQYEHGLFIPEQHLTMLCRKFVKGITWLATKCLIDEDKYTITSSPSPPSPEVIEQVIKGEDYSRPPGLIIKRIVYKEDPITAFYAILIWQQYLLFSYCRRSDLISSSLPTGLPQQPA